MEMGVFFNTAYICVTTEEVVKNGYNHLTLIEKIAKLKARKEAQEAYKRVEEKKT